MPIKDKTGQKFGRLTVIGLSHTGARGVAFWECSCECGGSITVIGRNLGGATNSCGCIRKELNATYYVTHGLSGTDTHRIWKGIVSRCTIPSATGYARYGAKGVSVCDRWSISYENFLSDMGERPSKDYSVDRIDNTKGYSPENCRWATRLEQNRNTRSNRNITVDGITKCNSEWAESIGVHESLIRQRMARGWSAEDAVKTPKNSTDRGLLSGTSRTITVNNETRTVSGWAHHLGVKPHTIKNKLAKGIDGVEAVLSLMVSA